MTRTSFRPEIDRADAAISRRRQATTTEPDGLGFGQTSRQRHLLLLLSSSSSSFFRPVGSLSVRYHRASLWNEWWNTSSANQSGGSATTTTNHLRVSASSADGTADGHRCAIQEPFQVAPCQECCRFFHGRIAKKNERGKLKIREKKNSRQVYYGNNP